MATNITVCHVVFKIKLLKVFVNARLFHRCSLAPLCNSSSVPLKHLARRSSPDKILSFGKIHACSCPRSYEITSGNHALGCSSSPFCSGEGATPDKGSGPWGIRRPQQLHEQCPSSSASLGLGGGSFGSFGFARPGKYGELKHI